MRLHAYPKVLEWSDLLGFISLSSPCPPIHSSVSFPLSMRRACFKIPFPIFFSTALKKKSLKTKISTFLCWVVCFYIFNRVNYCSVLWLLKFNLLVHNEAVSCSKLIHAVGFCPCSTVMWACIIDLDFILPVVIVVCMSQYERISTFSFLSLYFPVL